MRAYADYAEKSVADAVASHVSASRVSAAALSRILRIMYLPSGRRSGAESPSTVCTMADAALAGSPGCLPFMDASNRANFRALAPYQVNMFTRELARLPGGLAVPMSDEIGLLVWYGDYDSDVGVKPQANTDALIV